jgi:hypothetical protein
MAMLSASHDAKKDGVGGKGKGVEGVLYINRVFLLFFSFFFFSWLDVENSESKAQSQPSFHRAMVKVAFLVCSFTCQYWSCLFCGISLSFVSFFWISFGSFGQGGDAPKLCSNFYVSAFSSWSLCVYSGMKGRGIMRL